MNIAKKVIFTLLIFASFSSYSIERQLEQNWCWAASIQDVLRQAGVNQTQQQIATVLDGWPRNRPAHVNSLNQLYHQWRWGGSVVVGAPM